VINFSNAKTVRVLRDFPDCSMECGGNSNWLGEKTWKWECSSSYLYSIHADNILLDRKFCHKIYKFINRHLTRNRSYILAIPIHITFINDRFPRSFVYYPFSPHRNRWRSKTSYKIVMKRKRRFIVIELMMNLIPQDIKLIDWQSLVGTISVHSMHSLCTLENFSF